MKISVKIKPGSKKECVERVDGTNFIIHIKAPPVDGKANDALVRVLSDYFGVHRSQISIIRGAASKYKLIEIDGLSFL